MVFHFPLHYIFPLFISCNIEKEIVLATPTLIPHSDVIKLCGNVQITNIFHFHVHWIGINTLMGEGFMGEGVHPPLRSFLISDFVL